MKELLKNFISANLRKSLKRLVARLQYFGWWRYCPICNSSVRFFRPGGVIQRPDVACPVCDGAERHRLAWVFLSKHTNLLDGSPKRMLHVAPDYAIRHNLEKIPSLDYFTSSYDGLGTRVKLDITAIPFPADHFNCMYCSHVLEHIPDDRKAMREFFRVLKPGGWALLQVPITPNLEQTFEDPSVTDPKERERIFGQDDHVRLYGADYPDRLKESGFIVKVLHSADVVGEGKTERLGIDVQEDIFFCQKPLKCRRYSST